MPRYSAPSTTGLADTVPFSSTTITILRAWSDMMATSGRSLASYGCEAGRRRRPKMPGTRNPSGFGQRGAAGDGAGIGVQRVVDEIHHPLVHELVLVHEPDGYRLGIGQGRGAGTVLIKARVVQVVGFRGGEDEMDRIDGHDRGQERRARRATDDQVAGIDLAARHASIERGADLGEGEIQFRLAQFGRGDLHLGGGVGECGAGAIEIGDGADVALDQFLGAVELGLRQCLGRFGGSQVGLGRSTAIVKVLWSIENRRSPFLTICPSSKLTLSR